jgi:hypothetical protein
MSAIAHIAGRAIDAILHPIIRRALEPTTRRVDELERDAYLARRILTPGADYTVIRRQPNPTRQ